MGVFAGPKVVSDGLVLSLDPGNIFKSVDSTSNNFLQNGSFAGGLGVTYEQGSNPTNTIVELENPGDSNYVLRQNGNNTEYQMNIDGGAQGTLSASTQYVMSGWYATSDDYNGGDTMFHARAYSTGGSHNATGNGIGTLLYSVEIGGLTWEYRYQTITTPSDYSGNFDWYMGYGTTNTTGYRYYTGLKVEEGSFPSLLDLSRNGNDAKIINGTSYSSANGGSLVFDGVNDYANIGNVGSPQQFTFSCWLNATELNKDANNNYRRVLVSSVSANIVLIEQGGPISFRVPGHTNQNNYTAGSVSLNTWTQITCVYDQDYRKIYQNGNLEGQQQIGSATVNFGNIQITDVSGQIFKGFISNIQLYNKALTASEIKQNYNATRGRYGI